jgi:hypothetical protein
LPNQKKKKKTSKFIYIFKEVKYLLYLKSKFVTLMCIKITLYSPSVIEI